MAMIKAFFCHIDFGWEKDILCVGNYQTSDSKFNVFDLNESRSWNVRFEDLRIPAPGWLHRFEGQHVEDPDCNGIPFLCFEKLTGAVFLALDHFNGDSQDLPCVGPCAGRTLWNYEYLHPRELEVCPPGFSLLVPQGIHAREYSNAIVK